MPADPGGRRKSLIVKPKIRLEEGRVRGHGNPGKPAASIWCQRVLLSSRSRFAPAFRRFEKSVRARNLFEQENCSRKHDGLATPVFGNS